MVFSVVGSLGLDRIVQVSLAGVLRCAHAGAIGSASVCRHLTSPVYLSRRVSVSSFCSRCSIRGNVLPVDNDVFFRSESMNQIQFFDPEHRSPEGVSGAHLATGYLRPTAAAEKRQQSAKPSSPFDPIFPFRLSVYVPVSFRPVASVARPVRSQNDCQDPASDPVTTMCGAQSTPRRAQSGCSHIPSMKILFFQEI
jgi:hypothetical protein